MSPAICRVLAADDDPTVALLLRATLKAPAFALTVFDNGLAAVDACRQEIFDIVLLDVEMPGLDGLAAAAEIRAMRGAGLPLVLVSGREDAPFIAECERLAARRLAKPVDWRALAEQLRAWSGHL